MIKVDGYYYNCAGNLKQVDKTFKDIKQAQSYCEKIAQYDYGACELFCLDESGKCILTIRSY